MNGFPFIINIKVQEVKKIILHEFLNCFVMSVSHICNELILERTNYASVSGTLISMELNSSTRLMYHIAIPIFVSCKYISHDNYCICMKRSKTQLPNSPYDILKKLTFIIVFCKRIRS